MLTSKWGWQEIYMETQQGHRLGCSDPPSIILCLVLCLRRLVCMRAEGQIPHGLALGRLGLSVEVTTLSKQASPSLGSSNCPPLVPSSLKLPQHLLLASAYYTVPPCTLLITLSKSYKTQLEYITCFLLGPCLMDLDKSCRFKGRRMESNNLYHREGT